MTLKRTLPAWAWPLLALPIVAGVDVWTYRTIAAAVQHRLETSLQTTLASKVSAVTHWLSAQADLAELLAADPRVREDIATLEALARKTAADPEALSKAPAQARLREVVGKVVSSQHDAGFVVVDRGSLILARTTDERIGERLVLSVADAAAAALSGQRVFLPPTIKQHFAATPMAFVLVPVRDEKGAAVASLGFRIPPLQMTDLLNDARLGETSETYAIDDDGRMVTESRFGQDVAARLPPEAHGQTAAFLELRDLTRVAAEVVGHRSGVDARGYKGYRGVEVVGAWQWVPDWGIGLVTEIDRDEAYQTLATVRRAFRLLTGALVLVAAAIALASRRVYKLQKDVARAARLGQYVLEDKIGEGGMGAVYRARHTFLRRPTAIKLIRGGMASPEMLVRFEREVQLTSQLTNPNTIAIYDYGRTEEGIFYYAMEYLAGLPLDRVILDDGPQDEARVIHLLKRICSSLAEAHRIGLVHRDVKPANTMLCERGGTYDVVKVLDFGLVKELNAGDASLTGTDHVVGTPHYMSPEGVEAAANIGPRSDVYAVGALAYALVTGKTVFAGNSAVEIIGHHLHTPPVPPSERLGRAVSPFLERLILTCLAKNPSDRPADAGVLLQQTDAGWSGPIWTQEQARSWWETRAPAMIAARRAAEQSVSRGPKLAVDVASRNRSGSVPELEIVSGAMSAVRPDVQPGPRNP